MQRRFPVRNGHAAPQNDARVTRALEPTHLQNQIEVASNRVFGRLGYGLSESVYQRALMRELKWQGIDAVDDKVVLQVPYERHYAGTVRSDILLHCRIATDTEKQQPTTAVVVELKAQTTALNEQNVHQLEQYMRLLGVRRGLLVNFDQSEPTLRIAMQGLFNGAGRGTTASEPKSKKQRTSSGTSKEGGDGDEEVEKGSTTTTTTTTKKSAFRSSRGVVAGTKRKCDAGGGPKCIVLERAQPRAQVLHVSALFAEAKGSDKESSNKTRSK